MTLQEQIDFFFAPPLPQQSGRVSPLHLARREAQDCLIGDVIEEDKVMVDSRRHRLFATVLVIMSAIDLLAKFHAGNDENGGVVDRFRAFGSAFIFAGYPSPDKFADVLYYGCRNPLLHSFGLRSNKNKYTVMLIQGYQGRFIAEQEGVADGYLVCIDGLFGAFVKAVRQYESALRNDADLQAKFASMFDVYGSIGVAEVKFTFKESR